MAAEYIIYADESEKKGRYYSNFYGGALVRSTDLMSVESALEQQKESLGFHGEVKWQKVTANYLTRYQQLMDLFFDFVAAGQIKVRIMFTKNIHVPQNLTREQTENQYFLLYYQFIKHAFGLAHSNPTKTPVNCRLYFDQFPDTREKAEVFKGYLRGLSSSAEFRRARIRIGEQSIAEVTSHDHVILQCLDIVLGSMQFRLNDKHKTKPPGSHWRGKKTRAKEHLYRHMNRRVRSIYPNFNIGISTGVQGEEANRWHHEYRHWLFVPADHVRDRSRAKP